MEKKVHQSLVYYLHGANPRVLFLSGMHGDEFESGLILLDFLKRNSASLPDFLYIPKVSPSAVAAKTRKNKYNHDINRQFHPGTTDPEAKTFMSLLSQQAFDICIDVHEDPDRTLGFYLYDSDQMTEEELEAYRSAIHTTRARLYTGIDDTDDEDLMLNVEKGYVSLGFQKTGKADGFASRWFYENNIVKRSFTTEIPGKAKTALKKSLIQTAIPLLV